MDSSMYEGRWLCNGLVLGQINLIKELSTSVANKRSSACLLEIYPTDKIEYYVAKIRISLQIGGAGSVDFSNPRYRDLEIVCFAVDRWNIHLMSKKCGSTHWESQVVGEWDRHDDQCPADKVFPHEDFSSDDFYSCRQVYPYSYCPSEYIYTTFAHYLNPVEIAINTEVQEKGHSDFKYDDFSLWIFRLHSKQLIVSGHASNLRDFYVDAYEHNKANNINNDVLEKNMEKIAVDTVTIPSRIGAFPVVGIEANAFQGNAVWKQVSLPDGLKFVGKDAFSRCKNIKSIEIPASVEQIDGWPFGSIKKVTIADGNAVYSLYNNFFLSKDGAQLLYITQQVKNILTPNSVKVLRPNAFEKCKSTISIRISGEVRELPAYIFAPCKKLEELHLSEHINKMPNPQYLFCQGNKVTIYAPAKSYAEKYAKRNNIPFVEE